MDEKWFLYFGLFLLIVFCVDAFTCGDTILDEGEVCDRDSLNRENCTNFNYTGGDLECLDDCSGYYWGNCEGDEVCGNGVIGEGEICEIGNVRNRTCENEGYESGSLKCRIDCTRYDYNECTGNRSVCGDGEITGSEDCDGDLNGESCESLGFLEGELSCVDCEFDISLCVEEEIIEVNETEELNESEEVGGEVPSGVVGVVSESESSSSGMSLSSWLLIILSVLVIGVVVIWFIVFKK